MTDRGKPHSKPFNPPVPEREPHGHHADAQRVEISLSSRTQDFLTRLFSSGEFDGNAKLDAILAKLEQVRKQMTEDTKKLIARFDAASNKVAAKLQKLIDLAATQGSVTEAEVRAALEPEVAELEELGKDPNDPAPTE